MAVWAVLLWIDTNLWLLCLLVRQFAQALNPVAHKKGTFCCFLKCLGFYCVQISKWTAWVLTNAAACSQGKSPFIYRLFKDKKKLYLYNPPAHSLTNSYLPQPRSRRTIYETLKENTQLSHRLLAGRSCDATGFWWWQSCKCIKKDFFSCTISLIGCVSRRLLRTSSWNSLGADSPGCCVCTAPTRLNEAVCLQSMGLSDPWMLGSSLFLFPADIYFKGAWPHRSL